MDPKYLETLQLYYEEEVEGEAYFLELAKAFDDPAHKAKLVLLAEVERHAAEAVVPLLERHHVTPRFVEMLRKMGREDARATTPDWAKLVAGMTETYPGYLVAFETLETMAPAEDRPRLSFLTEHEVAAIRFLKLEAENPALSVGPLEDYLAADPATWTVAAV